MVTIINRLTVTGDEAEFLRILSEITAYMKSQPGFVGHHLYRSIRNPNVFIETGQWKDAADHQAAMKGPEFGKAIQQIIQHASAEPDLFEEVG
jgi:long-chain acyl-CoA synthetase